MTSYKRVFTIKNPHGPGGVFFAWQRTSGGYLATTGYDQAIHIYNRSDWNRLRETESQSPALSWLQISNT